MKLSNTQARQLVQQLSRTAVALDRSLFGPPTRPAPRVDYQHRQRQQEKAARVELEKLKSALNGLAL